VGKLGGQGGDPIDRNREASWRFSPDWPTGLGKTTTPRHRLRSLSPQRHPPAGRSRYHCRRVLPIVDATPSPKRSWTPLLRRSARAIGRWTPPQRPWRAYGIAGRNADGLGWWCLRFGAVHSITDSSRTSPPSTATKAPWLGDRLKGGGSEVGWPPPQASGPPVWLWSMPGFRVDNLGEMSSQGTQVNTIL
jgi:hypothetical protein